MSYCATCIDAGKEKSKTMDNLRDYAKLKANEKGQAQAICKDEIEGTFFTVDATSAFQQHLLIVEVVSGLSTAS